MPSFVSEAKAKARCCTSFEGGITSVNRGALFRARTFSLLPSPARIIFPRYKRLEKGGEG